MKVLLKGLNSKFELAGESAITIMNSREQKEKKNEQSLREVWDTFKCTNKWVSGVTEERKEKQSKK